MSSSLYRQAVQSHAFKERIRFAQLLSPEHLHAVLAATVLLQPLERVRPQGIAHLVRLRCRFDEEFHPSALQLEPAAYYAAMMEQLRTALALFPHMLADVVSSQPTNTAGNLKPQSQVTGSLRISPFEYYSEMLVAVRVGWLAVV